MTKGPATLGRSTLSRDAIIEGALSVIDRDGFAALCSGAVSAQLGADITAHFPSFDALLLALAETMLRTSGPELVAEPADEDWRLELVGRVARCRRAMLSRRDGALLFGHIAAHSAYADGVTGSAAPLRAAGLSPAAASVGALAIDHFTIGHVLVEQSDAGGSAIRPGFEEQLNLLLAGIGGTETVLDSSEGGEWQSRFQSRLWAFLRDARESANISFARATTLNELDRRILLLIEAQGGMTLAAISMACGVDKAQISRAIKRMDEQALLSRSGIRSPILLSASGMQLAERLLRHADLRNRELTFGVSDEDLASLSTVLDTLLSRAIALFEQERKQAITNQRQESVDFQDLVDEGLPGENGVAVVRSRVLPPFVTLCSYVLRGGALAHKRQTGLSNFESWVMSEVGRAPPISWPQLVLALSRDQSQAGRAVNHLIEIGLVERSGRPGRRHGFFAPTTKGLEVNAIIRSTAVRRSEFLFQGIPGPELQGFMTTFETLAHNAEVQLAREKAIQELGRP